MHIKIVDEIVDYIQNIRNLEDVVTGLLATCLSNSPTFMDKLFLELGIPKIQRNKNHDYYVDTGFAIASNSYKWIKKENIILNFRPDIMVSKAPE